MLHEQPARKILRETACKERRLEKLERELADLRLLAEVSDQLAQSLDPAPTLERIVQLTVPHLADLAVVYLVQPDRTVSLAAVGHRHPDGVMLLRELNRLAALTPVLFDPIQAAIDLGAPLLLAEISTAYLDQIPSTTEGLELLYQIGPRSAILVPLTAHGKTPGVLALGMTDSGRLYSEADLPLVKSLALRAGMALENARTHQVLQQEVEQRRQAEGQLRESEARYRLLFEQSLDAILLTDAHGYLLQANQAACRLLGLCHDHLPNSPLDQLLPIESLRRQPASFFQPAPLLREFSFLRADGTLCIVEYSSCMVAPNLQQIILRDVTRQRRDQEERRKLDHKLQEAQHIESIGALAGGIAHDFNNILAGVLGNAELAILEAPAGSMLHHSITTIISGVKQAAGLTEQLLAYAGRGRVAIGPLALNQLISEMLDLLYVSSGVHCDLRHHFAADLPLIEADATQIRQIVLNLVLNAAEALVEQGTVTIVTALDQLEPASVPRLYFGDGRSAGPYVRLEVNDTGRGMEAATIERIFDPFFSTKRSGRGLGLAAVFGIVRRHQGLLDVQSTPGQGTRFRIWFPPGKQAEATLTAPAPRRSMPPGTIDRGALLVIDDDSQVRAVLARMLRHLGFSVYEAADGEAGLALLAREAPALRGVLIDLTMPGRSGDEIARTIVQRYPALHVVLMSGYSASEVYQADLAGEATCFLHKPFTGTDLHEALAPLL